MLAEELFEDIIRVLIDGKFLQDNLFPETCSVLFQRADRERRVYKFCINCGQQQFHHIT